MSQCSHTIQRQLKKVTILIVDDHKLIRDTWSFILNSDERFQVIAETDTGQSAIELSGNFHPDIILMDINMSPMNGFEATKKFAKFLLLQRSLVFPCIHSRLMLKDVTNGSGRLYHQNSSKEEMITAITEVVGGSKYICNEVKTILSNKFWRKMKNLMLTFFATGS